MSQQDLSNKQLHLWIVHICIIATLIAYDPCVGSKKMIHVWDQKKNDPARWIIFLIPHMDHFFLIPHMDHFIFDPMARIRISDPKDPRVRRWYERSLAEQVLQEVGDFDIKDGLLVKKHAPW